MPLTALCSVLSAVADFERTAVAVFRSGAAFAAGFLTVFVALCLAGDFGVALAGVLATCLRLEATARLGGVALAGFDFAVVLAPFFAVGLTVFLAFDFVLALPAERDALELVVWPLIRYRPRSRSDIPTGATFGVPIGERAWASQGIPTFVVEEAASLVHVRHYHTQNVQ
jgi:hypothetical protein